MAIIIPSRNIYDLQTKIVRSNDLESVFYTISEADFVDKELDGQNITCYQYGHTTDEGYDVYLTSLGTTDASFGRTFYIYKDFWFFPNTISVSIEATVIDATKVSVDSRSIQISKPIEYPANGTLYFTSAGTYYGEITIDDHPQKLYFTGQVNLITYKSYDFSYPISESQVYLYLPKHKTYSNNGIDKIIVVKELKISMKADALNFSDDKQKVFPEGNFYPKFPIQKTEFSNTGTTISGVLAYEKLAEEVVLNYKNGKETATILCSISDYYNEDGSKAISIDNSTGKMSFKMRDKVIPMVHRSDGKDRPMSKYKDGTSKLFQVIGTNIFYDGAVWQELTLQEVTQ